MSQESYTVDVTERLERDLLLHVVAHMRKSTTRRDMLNRQKHNPVIPTPNTIQFDTYWSYSLHDRIVGLNLKGFWPPIGRNRQAFIQ